MQDEGWTYKTFCYGDLQVSPQQLCRSCERSMPFMGAQGGSVTLRLAQNMFEGSTGCHEWEAGFFLAEYLLNRPDLVKGMLSMAEAMITPCLDACQRSHLHGMCCCHDNNLSCRIPFLLSVLGCIHPILTDSLFLLLFVLTVPSLCHQGSEC